MILYSKFVSVLMYRDIFYTMGIILKEQSVFEYESFLIACDLTNVSAKPFACKLKYKKLQNLSILSCSS